MKVPDVSFTAEQVAAATGVLARFDGAELAALAAEYRATGMDRSQLAADAKTLNALDAPRYGWDA